MFNIQIKSINDHTVFQISGSIDIYSSLDLKAQVDEMDGTLPKKLIFDFKNVDYVDSSGVGIMIRLLNQIEQNGGSLQITRLRPMIFKIFKVAGLTDFFEIITDENFNQNFNL